MGVINIKSNIILRNQHTLHIPQEQRKEVIVFFFIYNKKSYNFKQKNIKHIFYIFLLKFKGMHIVISKIKTQKRKHHKNLE